MICIFDAFTTDFSGNGLGTLCPVSCEVTETLNGEYELVMVHPLDEVGKWTRIDVGRILRVPVPSALTPQVNLVTQSETEIYKTNGAKRPILNAAETNAAVLAKYKKNVGVAVLEKTSDTWYKVVGPDGKQGYMQKSHLTYVRTELSLATATGEVVNATQQRDQPFRIYRIVPELDKITVYARHIFYDLFDNMIKSYKPETTRIGSAVVSGISENCLSEHAFTFYSDIDVAADPEALEEDAKTIDFINVNPVEALIGDDGVVHYYGGELARDWFDVYLINRLGRDSSIEISEGKNLLGINFDENETDVVTRIMPTGEDEDGELLYLPETYIDSEHIDDYPTVKWYHLAVDDCKENQTATSGNPKKTKAQCYEQMRAAAEKEFSLGCDLPTVTLKVDFLNVADTEEYRQYGFLQNVYLGDSVRVHTKRTGISVTLRMTQYTFDCLTRRYTSVTLGTVAAGLEISTISPKQIPDGVITGNKLAMNSVGAGQLQSGSVGSLQIRNAAIENAHIAHGAIGQAHIQQAAITYAHLAEACAESLTAGAIDAFAARINQLTAQNILSDTIGAGLVNAVILAAKNGTFDAATVTHLVSNVFNLDGNGTMDSVFIQNLSVSYAQMLGATLDTLVLKASNGKYYRITVDSTGMLDTTEVTLSDSELETGYTVDGKKAIIETNLTVEDINASNIKASQAAVNRIFASLIDTDTLLARQAFIDRLYTSLIFGGKSLQLLVGTDDDIHRWFTFAEDGLTIAKPGSVFQTITDASGYRIVNSEKGTSVGSFERNGLKTPGIQIGDLLCHATASGDWAWVDVV